MSDIFGRLELLGRLVVTLACVALIAACGWVLLQVMVGNDPTSTSPPAGYCQQNPYAPSCHGGQIVPANPAH